MGRYSKIAAALKKTSQGGGVTFPTTGLVSYYSMDNVVGTTVVDEVGGNDGETISTPTFSTANGINNNGVGLDGIDDYIKITTTGLDFASPAYFSLSAFVKTTNDGMVVGRYLSGVYQTNVQLRIHLGKLYVFFRGTGDSGNDICKGTNIITDGQWHHVVYVRSSTGLFGYLDSNLECSDTSISTNGSLNDDYFCIGAMQTVAPILPLNGSIDEVAIYNRALTSTEISDIYNSGAGKFYTP